MQSTNGDSFLLSRDLLEIQEEFTNYDVRRSALRLDGVYLHSMVLLLSLLLLCIMPGRDRRFLLSVIFFSDFFCFFQLPFLSPAVWSKVITDNCQFGESVAIGD